MSLETRGDALLKCIDRDFQAPERRPMQHDRFGRQRKILHRHHAKLPPQGTGIQFSQWHQTQTDAARDQRQLQIVPDYFTGNPHHCLGTIECTLKRLAVTAAKRVHNPASLAEVTQSEAPASRLCLKGLRSYDHDLLLANTIRRETT